MISLVGSSGNSALSNFRGADLTNGRILELRILQRVHPGTFRILLNGKALLVRSDLDLAPGLTYWAKSIRTESGSQLRLLQTINQETNFSGNLNQNSLYLKALMETGLPLEDSLLQVFHRFLKFIDEKDTRQLRLLSLYLEKGLLDEKSLFPLVEDSLTGGGNRSSGEGRGNNPDLSHSGNQENPNQQSAGNQDPGRQGAGSFGLLVNSRQSRNGHWVQFPLKLTGLDSPRDLRLALHYTNRDRRFNILVLDFPEKEPWAVRVESGPENRLLLSFYVNKPESGKLGLTDREQIEGFLSQFSGMEARIGAWMSYDDFHGLGNYDKGSFQGIDTRI